MNLENITLNVREEEIIDKKYSHYQVVPTINDRVLVIGIYGNGSADNDLIGWAYYLSNAMPFAEECNKELLQLRYEQAKDLTPWDFVERFYPNYSSCDEIAYNNDLQKIYDAEEEIGDCAHDLLYTEFGGDREEAMKSLVASNAVIYEKAIQGFIEQHPHILRS